MELEELLERARAASPNDRIELRDDLAAYGLSVVEALKPWLSDAALGRFAVRVIAAVARRPEDRDAAIAILRRAWTTIPSLRSDIDQLIGTADARLPHKKAATLAKAIDWTEYDRWNVEIVAALEHARGPGEPLYLDTDARWFRSLPAAQHAAKTGADPSATLAGVIAPTLAGSPGGRQAFRAHRERALGWQSAGQPTPPHFLALLTFFVSIAEEMVSDARFAANNYYGRLTQRLVDAGCTQYTKQHVEVSYRHDAYGLWGMLNEWLENQDGRFGLPTAYSLGALPYVSIPIGQALLRERDRQVLYRVFGSLLGQQRDLTPDDLAEALRGHITDPPFSSALARMWRSSERRPLLGAIFSRELEQWDGTTVDPTTDRKTARLVLAASLRTFPGHSVDLSIHVRGGSLLTGLYEIEAGTTIGTASESSLRIEESPFGSTLLDLQPREAVSVPDAMLKGLILRGDKADLRRPFRACTVLSLDPAEQRYVEVERIAAGERSVVLIREALEPQAEAMLYQLALPGWRALGPTEVSGLPAGWVLHADVEVIAGTVPGPVAPDLEPLVPNADISIALDGGVRLPGTGQRMEWLAGALPKVIISDAAAGDIALSLEAADSAGEPTLLGSCPGVGTVALPELDPGDYVLHAEAHGRRASRRIVIRGLDEPRPVLETAHVVGTLDEDDLVRAIRRRGSEERAISMLSPARRHARRPVDAGRWADKAPSGTREDEIEPYAAAPSPDMSTLPACAAKPGAHFWLLSEKGTVVPGTCSHCGLRKYFVNTYYGRRSAERELRAKQAVERRRDQLRHIRVSPLRTDDRWALLLDALSVIGAGSWTTFEGLSRELTPTTHPHEAWRNLAALGLVDLEIGQWNAFPTAWSCAEPAVVPIGENEFGFTGRKSERLRQALVKMGLEFVGTTADKAGVELPRVRARMESDEFAAALSQAAGFSVAVADPAVLVQWLPDVERVLHGLETVVIHTDPEVFNVARQYWEPSLMPREGDAVRFGSRPRTYGVVTGDGSSVRRTDYRLAKHAAAHLAGVPLMSYNRSTHVLEVPLGADLPAAYDRVAVLCSGRLPVRSGSKLAYMEIATEVAEELWSRLGPRAVK